MTIGQDTT